MLPLDPEEAARDAVRRTLSNFDAVVKFACRGAGSKGDRPVSAPLADPSAKPNETYTEIVGEALRNILSAMLTFTRTKCCQVFVLTSSPGRQGQECGKEELAIS